MKMEANFPYWSYSPRYARDFPERFIDGRGTYLEAEPTIGYIHRAF
jgi:hypothetical protein